MPTVVSYLLSKGKYITETGTGRCRVSANPKRSVKFHLATPLELAKGMRAAEENFGADKNELKNLDKCIRLLKQV